jgi:1,4-dihydroxy-2-naphthoate octaprenyltransferase
VDDWEMWEMYDEVRLSPRERLVLLQIEKDLRQDRRFARRMGDAHGRVWLPTAVLLLGIASAFVAVMGVRTSDPALLCCFALLWPLTLFQAFRLLCRAVRHRSHARPWRPGGLRPR